MFNNEWANELKNYKFTCDVALSTEDDGNYIPEGTIVKGGKKFLDRDYTTIFYNNETIDFMDCCLKEVE